jgi:hypothetical protein
MHRPRLSKLLDDAGVQKIKKGRETLVSYAEAQQCVQNAASEGRVRGPIAYPKPNDDTKIVKILEEQLRATQEAKKQLEVKVEKLQERVESLLHVETELKLLKAGMVEKEVPEEKPVRKGASATVDIKKRASKAINALLGKD